MTDAYDPATRPCLGHPTSGATALQRAILGHWTNATNLGVYLCRPTADGDPSVHGNGRAGDDGPGKDPCAEIAEWLVANHTILGVQFVIWNHRKWNVTYKEWRPYGCDVPGSKKDHHTGHVHWEINVDAGNRLTAAIIAPVLPHAEPPQPEPTPTPIPEIPDMDFFILNDNSTATQDQWYWWPELGGVKGTKAIIPSGSALALAQKSPRCGGSLEFDRPDLDAIPTLRS